MCTPRRVFRFAVIVAAVATAVAAAPQPPDAPPDPARVQRAVADAGALLDQNRPADAIARLEPLAGAAALRDPGLDAGVHAALGRAYDRQSSFDTALRHYQRALDDYRAIGSRSDQALTLRLIAQIHKNTGRYEPGLAAVAQAIALYDAIGDRRGAARAWITQGAIHDSIGDHRLALDSYERALPLFADERSHELANLLNEIGITQKNLGRYADAEQTYARGLEVARAIDDRGVTAFLLLNLAVLQAVVGDEQRAVETGGEALAVFRTVGNRRGETIVLENLASSYWMLGNRSRARETMQQVLDAVRTMHTATQEGQVLKDLGDMDAAAGDLDAANAHYDAALRIQRDIGERKSMASTLIAQGDLCIREARPADALRLAEEGLALAQQTGRPELEWSARRSIAAAAAAQGDVARAIDQLETSARIINDLRANVAGDMSRVAFVDTRQDVFEDLATLLMTSGRLDRSLEAAEAGRARAFADLLEQRLIVGKPADRPGLAAVRRAADDFEKETASTGLRGGRALLDEVTTFEAGHHELASLLTAKSPSMQEIRATAARLHATLVEYMVTDRRLLIWVVDSDGTVHGVSVDQPRAALEKLVGDVRTAIDASLAGKRTGPSADLSQLLRTCDAITIAPIAQWLPESAARPVIVIPHGPLQLLPFAAVEDDRGRPLIERHPLAFAPAAAIFAYTREKAASAARTSGALVVADPTPPAHSGLPSLPWARTEGRMVAKRLHSGAVRLLVGDDASEAAIKREAGGYAIVHIAAHGLIAPHRPLASSMAFRDGGGEDGYLRVDEVFSLDLSAQLVVLSGCSTGVGQLTGDGVIGLTRAFLYAGTPTVVVSQWNVSDRATAALMDRFYAELGAGASKARALRTAALAVRRTTPNPAFWAAFQATGEP